MNSILMGGGMPMPEMKYGFTIVYQAQTVTLPEGFSVAYVYMRDEAPSYAIAKITSQGDVSYLQDNGNYKSYFEYDAQNRKFQLNIQYATKWSIFYCAIMK